MRPQHNSVLVDFTKFYPTKSMVYFRVFIKIGVMQTSLNMTVKKNTTANYAGQGWNALMAVDLGCAGRVSEAGRLMENAQIGQYDSDSDGC
jgi:hypothetical protein